MSRHEIIGTYCGVRRAGRGVCEWQNDDGTLTIIGSVRINDSSQLRPQMIDIKGIVSSRESLRDGLQYRFYGDTRRHHQYGDQFHFESYVLEAPAGQEATVAYLEQCKHLGPTTAFKLWQKFGEQAVHSLKESPAEVSEFLGGRFTLEHAIAASELLKSLEKTERSKMGLLGLLKGRGFPRTIIQRLIDDYGVEAAQVVHRNPYILMRYKGVGFLKSDKMYLELKHNPARLKRQALCAWHAISSKPDGHTWFPFAVAREGLKNNISGADADIEGAMKLATRPQPFPFGGNQLLSEVFRCGQRWVAEFGRASQEELIADLIAESLEVSQEVGDGLPFPEWTMLSSQIKDVTDHQREAIQSATQGFVGVLSGRPGTGKTYATAKLVALIQSIYGTEHIAVAAPTGKAAVRITAAMEAAGVSIRARTIHSLLGLGGNGGFAHNRSNSLKQKFVIVDEASMIDVSLMCGLLEARAETTHILFVGDPNQLAPVGHGAPLRDLISSERVSHGTLTELHRNSGRIVKACREMIERKSFTPSEKIDLATGENLLVIERNDSDSQIEALTAVMQKYQTSHASGKDATDPIWDIQIIVAVNAKSSLGRKPLNVMMQKLLNPDGISAAGNPFKVGDKIICTTNGEYKFVGSPTSVRGRYEKRTVTEWDELTEEFLTYTEEVFVEDPSEEEHDTTPDKVYVANGEQAEVLEVTSSKTIARLTSPDRTIIIPRSTKGDSGDDSVGGSDSEEATGSGCAWELGYAISCHKSQGSEWPIVIVMLDDYSGAKMVCSRQWLYTGISRAKKFALLIGKRSNANAMCGRDALFSRKTFLKELIQEKSSVLLDAGMEPVANGIDPAEEFMSRILEGVC